MDKLQPTINFLEGEVKKLREQENYHSAILADIQIRTNSHLQTLYLLKMRESDNSLKSTEPTQDERTA